MSHIVFHISSYKSKNLLQCVNSIIENCSSENTVEVTILDLNNLDRSKNFPNINYQYMVWDKQVSKFLIREQIANSSDADYFFSIDQAYLFSKDWDKDILGLYNDGEVLSGNHGISFSTSYKFRTEYSEFDISEKTKTNFISPRFIFTKMDIFKKLPSLRRIKYFGESEVLSFFLNSKGIDIYAVPTEMFLSLDSDISSHEYLPFSRTHNYNLVIDMMKNKENIFFDDHVDTYDISNKIGYNFYKLSYHPFQKNDIEYSVETSIDDLSGTRFFGGIRSIY